jgi:hypothetical protein
MMMICKDCGNSFPSENVACPHCGSRAPTQGGFKGVSWGGKLVSLSVFSIFLLLLFFLFSKTTPDRVANNNALSPDRSISYAQAVPPVRQPESALERNAELISSQSVVVVKQEPVAPREVVVEVKESLVHVESFSNSVVVVTQSMPQVGGGQSDILVAEEQAESELFNSLKEGVLKDVRMLDFKGAREKISAYNSRVHSVRGAAYQLALSGQLAAAETFHQWISKRAEGFRLSRGGKIESSTPVNLRVGAQTYSWQRVYSERPEWVGDMINHLVLNALTTQELNIEERGLLLIQTVAFLSLYYPEKSEVTKKSEEMLALVLNNCANQVAYVGELFPEFYERYSTGVYFAVRETAEASAKTGTPEIRTLHQRNGETADRAVQQQMEQPTERMAIQRATELVRQTLPGYPMALEARYVTATTTFKPFMGESLKRYQPRMILSFNFRYRLQSGHERWNVGPVNMAYDTVAKRWIMMGFSEATITGRNFLETSEGQEALKSAVTHAVVPQKDQGSKRVSDSSWNANELRSHDPRHPRNKR